MDPNPTPVPNPQLPVPPPPAQPQPLPPKPNRLPIIIVGIVVLLMAVLGAILIKNSQMSKPKQTTAPIPTPTLANAFFDAQLATIQGEIIEIKNSTILIKNGTGQLKNFPISPKAVVFQLIPGTTQATPSADLKNIETGKKVLIQLELTNNEYQVLTITYLPPLVTPSPKPKL